MRKMHARMKARKLGEEEKEPKARVAEEEEKESKLDLSPKSKKRDDKLEQKLGT